METLQTYFSGPMLVPSVLLGLVCLYWLFVILGAFDIELFDFDIDVGAGDGSIFDVGLVSLKFINLGDVPLMIWGSVFSFAFWILTALVVERPDVGGNLHPWMIVLGCGFLAVLVTKVITNPLRGKFSVKEPNTLEELLGRECTITVDTNEKHGQANVPSDGAPLLLNVRTHEGTLTKGTTVRIVDFDQETHLYYVSNSDLEE
ncbi:hypothetical protein Pan258_18520 [Symmachiella dynata]|uniref:hypothetical protein n=1 Tax=Symmachiella dynata TaxID=2527995 RepID=UPI001188DB42|nr:hypothetical protein [Symmachiella dynata]QDT47814.1 hypothetical protein Pan258_18520 [Symmachiella dynata]